MNRWFSELVHRRDLLYMIVWREIRVRYKQSIMGYMWAIFIPMVIIMAGMVVRYAFSILTGKPLDISILATVTVKSLPWAFFISSFRFASLSLIGNANLVTKIYMPREIFPIAAVLSQLVDFTVASLTLAVILAVLQIGVSVHLLWMPVFVLSLIVLAMGLGLFLSAACLFFRDVKYLVEVFITFAIFFTPVFYEAEMFGEWANVILLNPVAPILEGLNATIVQHRAPDLIWTLYSVMFSVATFLFGFSVFKKWEGSFAESI